MSRPATPTNPPESYHRHIIQSQNERDGTVSNNVIVDSLAGKRAISVGRVSTDDQARTPSIDKQLEINRHFASKEGISIIEELRLEGMSASGHDHEPMLRPLIARKQARNDFDILLFMDYDRFSRDIRMGRRLWDDFLDANIEIVSATEPRAIGELAFMQQDMALYKAQSYVLSFAKHTSTGWNQAVLDGRLLPVTNVIYGLDKFFLSSEGQRLFILRDLQDGRKVKFNPTTGAIIEDIVKRKGEKAVQKRKSDIIRPVPGNPAHVKNVRDMFRWYHIDKDSVWNICKRLNDRGILSPQGKLWCESSVNQLLMNTIYTGVCIGFRRSYSKFVMRGKTGPVIHKVPRKKPAGYKGYTLINRPMKDWNVIDVPELADFLYPDVRVISSKWQWDRLKAREERFGKRALNSAGRRSGGMRHDPNKYILTGKIRAKQDDARMKGWSRAGNFPKTRYYLIGKFLDIAVSGDVRRRQVHAESLENAVLESLADTLRAFGGLEERITTHLRAYSEGCERDQKNIGELKAQLAAVEKQARILVSELSDDAKELFKEKAEHLARQRTELKAQIETVTSGSKINPSDARTIARNVKTKFAKILELLQERKLNSMRGLVDVFVSRCIVDLETRNVEVEFALPGWALADPTCLVNFRSGSDSYQTHAIRPMSLATYLLHYHRKNHIAPSFERERLTPTG